MELDELGRATAARFLDSLAQVVALDIGDIDRRRPRQYLPPQGLERRNRLDHGRVGEGDELMVVHARHPTRHPTRHPSRRTTTSITTSTTTSTSGPP